MDSSGSSSDCIITPNPDLIGIGIRLSIYSLALSGPFLTLVFRSSRLTSTIDTILGLTGFAILLASLVLTFQNSLDIFHAWCAIHLIQLAGVSIDIKGTLYPSQPSSTAVTALPPTFLKRFKKLVVTVGFYTFLCFILHILIKAPSYGPTPSCNSKTVYVVFGASIPTTNPVFRWLIGITVMWSFIVSAIVTACLWWFNIDIEKIITEVLPEAGGLFGNENSGADYAAAPPILIHQLAARSYIIAMLELTIKRNHLSRDSSGGIAGWSFGQVIAVAMLVAPVLEVIALVLERKRVTGRWIGGTPAVPQSSALSTMNVLVWMNFASLYSEILFDLLCSATCAVAAASTALRHTPHPLLPHSTILRFAARAGVVKAALRFFIHILSITHDTGAMHTLQFATTEIGFPVLVTTIVSQWFSKEGEISTPVPLQIAAVVAGVVQMLGGSFMWPGFGPRKGFEGMVRRSSGRGRRGRGAAWGGDGNLEIRIWCVIWDALSGLAFVRVARNKGYPIASNAAGFWAGAVYGLTRTAFMILSWPIVLLLVYLMVQATERMMNAPFSTSTEPGETDALLPAAAPRIEAQPAPGDLESGVTGGDSADDDDEGRSGGGHGAAEEEGDGKKNERSSGEGIGSASGSKSGSSEADSLGTGASAMASAGNDADVEAVEGSPGSPGRKSPVRGNTGDSQEAVKGAGKRIAVLEDIEMHPLGNDTP